MEGSSSVSRVKCVGVGGRGDEVGVRERLKVHFVTSESRPTLGRWGTAARKDWVGRTSASRILKREDVKPLAQSEFEGHGAESRHVSFQSANGAQ